MNDRSITLYLIRAAADDHRLVDDHGHEVMHVVGAMSHVTLANLHLFASVTLDAALKIVGEAITVTSVSGEPAFRVTEDVDEPVLRRLIKMIGGDRD